MAKAIQQAGLLPGSHIAILSKNCAHWIMADIAIMMAGCVSVPIYPTLSASAILPILEHSDSKAIFIGKLDDFKSQENGIPKNLIRFGFDDYGLKQTTNWNELITSVSPVEKVYQWQPDELMTIIYTSGTTGKPKGVMHTIGNFDTVLQIAIKELQLPKRPALFSYLPISHIAERVGIEWNLFGCYNFVC
jgi:long-chain acyl-CoA synthetase